MRGTALFAAALVVYGNAVALVFRGGLPGGDWMGVALGAGVAAASVAWARSSGLRAADLGVRRHALGRSALAGIVLSALAAAAALAVLRFPPLLGEPVSYAPAQEVDARTLAVHLVIFMPLGVVIPEELAFRGALLGALRRSLSPLRAAALSACAFALWHVAITLATIELTNLRAQPLFVALAAAGALLALLGGGAAFALVRLWTGNLAGCLTAHWGFNAAMLVGLRTLG